MKIFSSQQIKEWDQYTIQHEPISSIDLMERASLAFVNWFESQFHNEEQIIKIFVGSGNNGGDGLAIARLLYRRFYNIEVFLLAATSISKDHQINLKKLPQEIPLHIINWGALPSFNDSDIIIDAILGSGLSRSIQGNIQTLIEYLNSQNNIKIAVDIPSGVFAGKASNDTCLNAHYTFSFETPKMAFFIPENEHKIGQWFFNSIGLHPDFILKNHSNYFYLEKKDIQKLIKKRNTFSHKGNFGHTLLVAGSYGKTGAAILAAKACLKIGAGLLTVHIPKFSLQILQISIPEAMCSIDNNEKNISTFPSSSNYTTVGVGPGLGMDTKTSDAFFNFLKEYKKPIVVDADGLNILSKNKENISLLPQGSIITPHPKEFERLFGAFSSSWDKIKCAQEQAQKFKIIIVLKGAYTCIALPNGNCFFNSTGNPGMATAGSGDVLTGIISGLLSQGYSPENAAKTGVFIHGLAGDIARQKLGEHSLIASDIIEHLPHAFLELNEQKMKN